MDGRNYRDCVMCGFSTYFHYRECRHVLDLCYECWSKHGDYTPFVDVDECRQCHLIGNDGSNGIKKDVKDCEY